MPTLDIRAHPEGTRFFSVTVPNRGRESLAWSQAFATAGDARRHGQRRIDDGAATLAFVVALEPDGTRDILDSYTKPESARKIIRHYLELVDAIEPPEEA